MKPSVLLRSSVVPLVGLLSLFWTPLVASAAAPSVGTQAVSTAQFERMALQAVPVRDGILLIGGFQYQQSTCVSQLTLLKSDGTEKLLPYQLGASRNHFRVAKVDEDHVLVMGGFSQEYGSLAEVEMIDLARGEVLALPWLATPMELASSVDLPGKVILSGGLMAQSPTQTWGVIQTLDLQTKEITVSGAQLATSRFGHGSIWLPAQKKVLIVGGKNVSRSEPDPTTGKRSLIWTALKSMEFYDPATDTVTPAGTLTAERDRPALQLMPDGKVLIVGGAVNDPAAPKLKSIELYDPATQTSQVVGQMQVGRMAAALLPITNATGVAIGTLIASGWVDAPEAGRAIEYFDYSTHQSQTIANAASSRAEGAMLWLDATHVVLVGGKNNFGPADPAATSFKTTEIVEIKPAATN